MKKISTLPFSLSHYYNYNLRNNYFFFFFFRNQFNVFESVYSNDIKKIIHYRLKHLRLL